ncbi:MAG: Hsp20/alpha crystallin family protein [Suipraeoptans sp.]
MFKDPFFSRPFNNSSAQIMKTDVSEKHGDYLIDVELPGYKKEDIKADLKDGYLTISANKNEEKNEKDADGKVLRKERYTGSCNRSFYVGDKITQDDIKAGFNDGVLHLEFPKEKEAQEEQPKLITIE